MAYDAKDARTSLGKLVAKSSDTDIEKGCVRQHSVFLGSVGDDDGTAILTIVTEVSPGGGANSFMTGKANATKAASTDNLMASLYRYGYANYITQQWVVDIERYAMVMTNLNAPDELNGGVMGFADMLAQRIADGVRKLRRD